MCVYVPVYNLQVIIAALFASVIALEEEHHHAEVKDMKSDVRADGFDYHLAITNHILAQASGDKHGNIHGNFEWVDPKGVHVKVSYVADEHGYQPSSDLLPTPPPTPEAILKALEYIKAHPHVEEKHEHEHKYEHVHEHAHEHEHELKH